MSNYTPCPRCLAFWGPCDACYYGALRNTPPAAAGPEPMPEGSVHGCGDPECEGACTVDVECHHCNTTLAVDLDDLRALLATQGLAIVPVASVVSAEERALANCKAKGPCRYCNAIRARRAAKGGRT